VKSVKLTTRRNKELRTSDTSISSKLFLAWRANSFEFLETNINGADFREVFDFDEVEEGGYYILKKERDSFEGFAEAEAAMQTKDVVRSITSGAIDDETLRPFIDGEVSLEHSIHPPQEIASSMGGRIRFPIRPDALIFNPASALYMECKQDVREADVRLVEEKVEFLREHSTEPWFLKDFKHKYRKSLYKPPLKLQAAICSVTPIANNVQKKFPRVVFLVRKGLHYIKAVV
jgi:hypothetical protein